MTNKPGYKLRNVQRRQELKKETGHREIIAVGECSHMPEWYEYVRSCKCSVLWDSNYQSGCLNGNLTDIF